MRLGSMVHRRGFTTDGSGWGDIAVFARMMEGLASEGTEQKTIMIDATCLMARRTASSLRAKKGGAMIAAVARQGAGRAG